MAEPRKTKRTPKSRERKATERERPSSRSTRPNKAVLDNLTPDGLQRMWALHHPDRPEVRASLERLYRLSR